VRLHLALVDRRLELEQLVSDRTAQLSHTRAELIKRLSRVLELHESAAVSNRVMRLSQYAALLSHAAGAKPKVCEMMETAAPLHDIGKLGVPAEILRKREKLSVPDWERVKRHPEIGADIIGQHDEPLLKLARALALTHHEHWDGTGYPKGLKGEEIPWPGRVMAVADAFESMTTTQFHRDAISVDDASYEIQKGANRKYDPKIVEAFKKALPDMKKVLEQYSDSLGDMINLDFAPAAKAPAPAPAAVPAPKPAPAFAQWDPKAKPGLSAAQIAARAAAKRK
jgi:putative two-component system response regulator